MKKFCPLCKLCNNAKLTSQYTRENIGTVWQCNECGHTFLDLDIKANQYENYLKGFYEKDIQRKKYMRNYDEYIEKIKVDNIRRLSVCQEYLNPKYKVLDFGAGYCLFSYLIKPFVSEVTVVDRSNVSKTNAAKFGINHNGDVEIAKQLINDAVRRQ